MNDLMVQEEAKLITVKMKKENFIAAIGWLEKWKVRYKDKQFRVVLEIMISVMHPGFMV